MKEGGNYMWRRGCLLVEMGCRASTGGLFQDEGVFMELSRGGRGGEVQCILLQYSFLSFFRIATITPHLP